MTEVLAEVVVSAICVVVCGALVVVAGSSVVVFAD